MGLSRAQQIFALATFSSRAEGARSEVGAGLAELICRACVAELGVGGASVSLISPAGPTGPITGTDDVSRLLEQLQIDLGEGPTVEAMREGRPVLHPDLTGTGRLGGPDSHPRRSRPGLRRCSSSPSRSARSGWGR